MAKKFKEKYQQNQFVPVFWMASEDHDFEEINHIHFKGHKITWHREMGGAVGQMEVESCAKALESLAFHFPEGKRASYLTDLFTKAYQQKNLAEATRYLVNELFGSYGVVIVDGDDAKLKELVAPYFKRELLEGLGEKYVTESSEKLSAMGYKIQVNPRDVNLFYLQKNYRERLTRKESGFATADGKYKFTQEQILAELESYPERFSPNVILRPLYQEVILPNLAYIGGGGELAYWLQMKTMFEAFNVQFPMLRLRNSVGVTPRAISRKVEKLDLAPKQLFKSYHDLSTMLVKRNTDIDEKFSGIRSGWKETLNSWNDFTSDFDPTLQSSVEAERAKILKGLMRLEKKVIRNKKRHEGDKLRMLQEVKNELFPGNGLQERKDNFCKMYLAFGDDFIDEVLKSTRAFENEFTILSE
jgi:bacillithiol biosynthesis cysteine-adding enzyme BshC